MDTDKKDTKPEENQGADAVSKNAKKKAEKAEKLAAEKAKKEAEKAKKAEEEAAKKAAEGAAVKKKEKEEEILDPVMYFENRSKAVIGLKSQALTHPYPHKFEVTHTHDQYIKEFNDKCKENNKFDETTTVSIAGNLVIQVS
jgi:lysyl-tRNA synthetase, class II